MAKRIELQYKTTKSLPITIKVNKQPITYSEDIYFMVKKNICDPDEEAIINKVIEIQNVDGNPYHGVLELDLDDSSNEVGSYYYDFSTSPPGEKKNSKVGEFAIVWTVKHD